MLLDPRILAAADISLHGRRLIIIEFVVGAGVSLGLGLWLLLGGKAQWQSWLGLYLIGVGLNYVPLLFSAVSIPSREAADVLSAHILSDRSKVRGLTLKSLALLVPLSTFIGLLRTRHRTLER
ncbi:MAG TPA: hypothetical protein VF776_01515 [Sphingomicrobium sp.]